MGILRSVVVAFAMTALVSVAACKADAPPRVPLSSGGEQVSVLVDRPQSDSYRAIADLVGLASDPQKPVAVAAATDSVRNQAAEMGAGMVYIQRVDAEVDWKTSETLVKVYATAYKHDF